MPPRWNAPLGKHHCRRVRPAPQAGPGSKDRAAASASRKVGQNQTIRTFTAEGGDALVVFEPGELPDAGDRTGGDDLADSAAPAATTPGSASWTSPPHPAGAV